MAFVDKITLSNGVEIPRLGLGTWLLDDAQAATAVKAAVETGYRLIDTAQAYGNEAGVGEGVRNCGISRDQLFVGTKLAAEHKDYATAAASIDESLAKAGLDYFDLMIIHSPQPWVEVNQSEDRHEEGNCEAWAALEDAYKAGKLRAIGVSNFQVPDIRNILDSCTVAPMVNQVLAHVGNTPKELIDWCQANGIAVEAYSPVAHGAVLNNAEVTAMAQKYGVSVAQLCIRYCLQLGLVALPKSGNPEHIKANAQVDFAISDDDMQTLVAIAPITDYGDANVFPVFGGRL